MKNQSQVSSSRCAKKVKPFLQCEQRSDDDVKNKPLGFCPAAERVDVTLLLGGADAGAGAGAACDDDTATRTSSSSARREAARSMVRRGERETRELLCVKGTLFLFDCRRALVAPPQSLSLSLSLSRALSHFSSLPGIASPSPPLRFYLARGTIHSRRKRSRSRPLCRVRRRILGVDTGRRWFLAAALAKQRPARARPPRFYCF